MGTINFHRTIFADAEGGRFVSLVREGLPELAMFEAGMDEVSALSWRGLLARCRQCVWSWGS